MFSAFKYRTAKNFVLMKLSQDGHLAGQTTDLMREIAGNPANLQYGLSMLKSGIAKDKYSAAAAVFARLACLYESSPRNGLTDLEWRIALREAMRLAGASELEIPIVEESLIEMNKGTDNIT
jgi:hypothetical protein